MLSLMMAVTGVLAAEGLFTHGLTKGNRSLARDGAYRLRSTYRYVTRSALAIVFV